MDPPLRARIGIPALAVAAVTAGAPAAAQTTDPWFGPDKALHFSLSGLIAMGGYGTAAVFQVPVPARVAAGAALALTAGVGKELYDLGGGGTASARDLTWDILGTASGLLIAWTLDALLFPPRAPRGRRERGPRAFAPFAQRPFR